MRDQLRWLRFAVDALLVAGAVGVGALTLHTQRVHGEIYTLRQQAEEKGNICEREPGTSAVRTEEEARKPDAERRHLLDRIERMEKRMEAVSPLFLFSGKKTLSDTERFAANELILHGLPGGADVLKRKHRAQLRYLYRRLFDKLQLPPEKDRAVVDSLPLMPFSNLDVEGLKQVLDREQVDLVMRSGNLWLLDLDGIDGQLLSKGLPRLTPSQVWAAVEVYAEEMRRVAMPSEAFARTVERLSSLLQPEAAAVIRQYHSYEVEREALAQEISVRPQEAP